MVLKFAAAIVAAAGFSITAAGIDPVAFADNERRESYQAAIRQLRCMVCQNQTLAESDAPLARDMRAAAAKMAQNGKSADDIAEYIAARYGDFAVYRPPFDKRTAALWLAPFALAVVALCLLPLIWRRRKETAE